MSKVEPTVTKRCAVCGRFRSYHADDRFCIGCGHEGLESACVCGRGYGYALAEDATANLHCPHCGRSLRGRSPEFDG